MFFLTLKLKLIFLFFQNGNKTDQCGNNGHLLPVQQKLEINIFFFLSDHSGIVTFVPVFQSFVYLFEIQSTNSKVKQNLWLT